MDFKSNQTIVSQIIIYMKKQIFSGKLPPGHKIMPIREFATFCSVNPNTITKAYAILEEEKLIYTDSTLGKFVTVNKLYIKAKRLEFLKEEVENFKQELKECGVDEEEFISLVGKEE